MSVDSSPQRPPTAEPLLREVGNSDVSGVLEVAHPDGSSSHVWLREGRVYALQVPGYRPALGIRLLSGGLVSPEQLSAAAVEQRERRPGQLIGEVLVGMQMVSPSVIDAFVREQVLDQAADLLDLEVSGASFHAGRHIRQGLTEAVPADELLAAAADCRARRTRALARIGGADVVPTLGPPVSSPTHTPLGPYDWALLCRVDGARDVTELARVCGFTVVEAAQIVADLAMTGLLELPAEAGETETDVALAPIVALPNQAEPAEPEWSFQGTDAGEPDPVPPDSAQADVRSELLSEFGALLTDDSSAPAEPPARVPPSAVSEAPTATPRPAPEQEPEPTAHHAHLFPAAADHADAPAGLVSSSTRSPEEPTSVSADVSEEPTTVSVEVTEEPATVALDVPEEAATVALDVPDEPDAPVLHHPEATAPAATIQPVDVGGATYDPVPEHEVGDGPAPRYEPGAGHEPTLTLVTPGSAVGPPDPAERPPNPASGAGYQAPTGAPTRESAPDGDGQPGGNRDSDTDTTAFMRELSSLSDDPEEVEPVVTRLVVPLKEQRRKRRLWGR